jgi:hypothetical protein
LPTSSGEKKANPVTLPPGRARLLTSPLDTAMDTEYDGNDAGDLLGGQSRDRARSEDNVGLARELCCQRGEPLDPALGRSVVDHEIAAFDIPEVTQSVNESFSRIGGRDRVVPEQVADPNAPDRRLGLDGERHGDSPSQRGQQEAAAVHAGMMGLLKRRRQMRHRRQHAGRSALRTHSRARPPAHRRRRAVQIAAAAVLGKEGVQVGQQGHGPRA